MNYGRLENHGNEIEDMNSIMRYTAASSELGSCIEYSRIAELVLYLSRHHSVEVRPASRQQYAICDTPGRLPAGYSLVEELNLVSLYRFDVDTTSVLDK